jgi:hypothetical protein
MSGSPLSRWSLLSAGAFSLALLSACSDGGTGPGEKAHLVIQQAVTNTSWDFTGLIGTANGVQDWGVSKQIDNPPNGSIVATTGNANTHVTSKGRELPVGDTERGLGICLVVAAVCSGDEVGDGGVGTLFLNLNGVLPAGSTLTQIDLGSVQTAEGWLISKSTTGLAGPYTLLSSGEGNGVNNVGDNVTITTGLPLPTANLVLRFEKNTAASGNLTTDNDYVVKSLTTSFETSEGCTFTIGYWKTHPDAWPAFATLALGSVNYTKAELLAILNAPVKGNGLISLAHQLIGAKLNVYPGTNADINSADALIGALVVPPKGSGFLAPSTTSSLNTSLTNFNEGITGPGHCDE